MGQEVILRQALAELGNPNVMDDRTAVMSSVATPMDSNSQPKGSTSKDTSLAAQDWGTTKHGADG